MNPIAAENIYRNLVEASPYPIYLCTGENLIITVANKATLNAWGKDSSIIGKPFTDALPELDEQPFKELLSRVYHTGETYTAGHHLASLFKDGVLKTFYFNFTFQPLRNEKGIITDVMCFATDVTEVEQARTAIEKSKKARHELERLNSKLADAVEEHSAANEELISANQELVQSQKNVQHLNSDLEERVSLRTHELATTNEELKSTNEDLAALNEELQQVQHSLYELNNELEMRVIRRTKDLSESEERFRNMAEGSGILITVSDEHKQDTYFSKAWVNLTGRNVEMLLKNGWEDLIHPEDLEHFLYKNNSAFKNKSTFNGEFRVMSSAGEYRCLLANGSPRFRSDGSFAGHISTYTDITELKKDEQRKNDFIGMVSHELKTPLTSLSGYLQILYNKSKKNNDPFSTNALDTANKQVKKMTTMINGFLNLSRLESGKIVLNKSNFRLDQLLKSTVEESILLDSSHQITYTLCAPLNIYADQDKISNVISNLISNAIKYSPNGTKIEASCKVVHGTVQIMIKDYGMGISAHDLPNIFERYYRVERSGTISGFGIGLYLSAEIIERHEGRLWAESTLGEGSVFYFSLPIAN